MKFESEFTPIALDELHHEAAVMKVDGWRFIQTHAVNTDNGIDLYYSFMKNGHIKNLKVAGVTKENPVPSITDLFLAAFVFENEARELFGVDMRDIAIDFSGALYAPAIDEPMTIITPEQKAAREKARKAKAAKEAKGDEASAPASAEGAPRIFVMTPERRQRLDAKLATMSPEKVAKVEAALKAREAEAAAAAAGAPAKAAEAVETPASDTGAAQAAPVETPAEQTASVDHDLESKIALLDADKAAKVRAAIAARNGEAPASAELAAGTAAPKLDAALENKLALMDAEKAQKVRDAIAAKAAREASAKGGE